MSTLLQIKRTPPRPTPVEEINLLNSGTAEADTNLLFWRVGQGLCAGQPKVIRIAEFDGGRRNRNVYDLTPDEVDRFTTALRELAGLS